MEYINPQSRFMKEPYAIEPFEVYVRRRIASICQAQEAPAYAVAGEQKRIEEMMQALGKDPYGAYESVNNAMNALIESHKCEAVTRLSDAIFYDVMIDCCEALGFKNTVGYVYAPAKGEFAYNAMALGYVDMAWVMVSKAYREQPLLDDLELACMIGHQLGHVAAKHGAVSLHCKELTGEETRGHEHTCDRAGLLAALWRAEKRHPELDAKALTALALKASVGLQHKLELLSGFAPKGGFTQQTLTEMMEQKPLKESHAKKNDTHPTGWERIRHLEDYVQKIEFLECIHAMWGADHRAARRL